MFRAVVRLFRALLRRLSVGVGAIALTLLFFLVLPVIQAISKSPEPDYLLRNVEAAYLPPPPTTPENEEPEEDPEPEERPPELEPDSQPLDLSQLELALDPGFGEGWNGADFALDLKNVGSSGEDIEAMFSLADLDQEPRAISRTQPIQNSKTRKKAPGTVYIVFEVDERGRVQDPKVLSSDDPVFERPALQAVKQWRFEPGKRNGKPVKFRIRIPITFPKQG